MMPTVAPMTITIPMAIALITKRMVSEPVPGIRAVAVFSVKVAIAAFIRIKPGDTLFLFVSIVTCFRLCVGITTGGVTGKGT